VYLKKCSNCNKETSARAKNCQHCGSAISATTKLDIAMRLAVIFVIGLAAYSYFGDSNKDYTQAQIAAAPMAEAIGRPDIKPVSRVEPIVQPSLPKPSPEPKRITSDEIQIANDFCQDAGKIYEQIDSSFKHFQTGLSESKKHSSPERMLTALQSYSVRASELEEDAGKLDPPKINSDTANASMSEMAKSIQGIARKNAEGAENLQTFLSAEQSPERSQENAELVGAAKDRFTIRYSASMLRLFNALGYSLDDVDDKTLCLKKSVINKLLKEPA
jgi:hypothetical protein